MPVEPVLDLSEVDPPEWRVMANGSVYGPYTLGQIQGFIAERRVGPGTQIADGDGGAFMPAGQYRLLANLFRPSESASAEPESEPSNYLIIAKLDATGDMQFISAINRLGAFAEIMPGVFALRSRIKQNKLRERLQATVASSDQLMIANTSTGRLAWLNLGPEADIHIRRVWDAKLD